MAIEIQTKLEADKVTKAIIKALVFRLRMLSEKFVVTPGPLKALAEKLPDELAAEKEMLLEAVMILEDGESGMANAFGAIQKIETLICSEDEEKIA